MITQIKLKAFKAFPNKSIDFKPLTLLAGINNSGKSSVIQALRMYCNAANGDSPLLDGHGTLDEMHSLFSPASEPLSISCQYTDDSSILRLNKTTIERPEKSPVHCYIGANRHGPQTSLPLLRSLGDFPQMGDQGEYVLDFLQKLANSILPEPLVYNENEGRTLEYVLSGWLNEISPGVKFDYHTTQKTDSAYAEIDGFRPANVGFGLSYTLPILVAILGMAAHAPASGWDEDWGKKWEDKKEVNGVLLILENPEAHLHPQGQTAMGRLIALAASCGVQLVVETHSDHLMDGIRIAVKEKNIKADEVIFQYFTRNSDGMTDVVSPKLNDSGKLDFWPEGFFDQTLKNRAILARKD